MKNKFVFLILFLLIPIIFGFSFNFVRASFSSMTASLNGFTVKANVYANPVFPTAGNRSFGGCCLPTGETVEGYELNGICVNPTIDAEALDTSCPSGTGQASGICLAFTNWGGTVDTSCSGIAGQLGGVCVQGTTIPESDLSVVCEAYPNPVDNGEAVDFVAYVAGGNGTYVYTWNGDCGTGIPSSSTADDLSTCTKTFSINNTRVGIGKAATISVSSGSKTASATCNVALSPYPELDGSCDTTYLDGDDGNKVLFVAYVWGGNDTYTYSWGPDGYCTGSTTNSCTATTTDSFSKQAKVVVTSGSQSKTIFCTDKKTLEASCTAKIDPENDQKVNFSVDYVSGGTGPYTYVWGKDPDGNPVADCTGSTSSTCSKTFTDPGMKWAVLAVTAGDDYSVYVYCSQYVFPPTPPDKLYASCVADADPLTKKINFVAIDVEGGNGTYSYVWGQDSSTPKIGDCSRSNLNTTATTDTCTIDDTAGTTAFLTVTSGDQTKKAYCPVDALKASCEAQAYQDPGSGNWFIDFLISNVEGGTGTYTYSWKTVKNQAGDDIGDCTDANSLQCLTYLPHVCANSDVCSKSFPGVGKKTSNVTVTSGAQAATVTCSTTLKLDAACQATVASGQVNYKGDVVGGTGTYTYKWGEDANGNSLGSCAKSPVVNTNSLSDTCSVADSADTQVAYLTVTSGDETKTVTCSKDPLNAICEALSGDYDNPKIIDFMVDTVSGGEPDVNGEYTYTYSWGKDSSGDPFGDCSDENSLQCLTYLPHICTNSDTCSRDFSADAPGTKIGSLTVTSGAVSRTVTCSKNIEADPTLQVTCSPSKNPAYPADEVTFTVIPTGGSGSYDYLWLSGTGDNNCLNSTDSTCTRAYTDVTSTTPVVKTETVQVTSGSQVAIVDCPVTISNTSDIHIACSTSPSPAYVNEPVDFGVLISGGNGTYNYSWSGDCSGTTSNSTLITNTCTTSYASDGLETAYITVTSGNKTAGATCPVNISAYPELSVGCSANPSSVSTGEQVHFVADVVGGNGTYTYTWLGACTDSTASTNLTSDNCVNSYATEGIEQATIKVVSGNQTEYATCSADVQNDPTDFAVSCSANPVNGLVGQAITYTASASGGNGVYDYTWTAPWSTDPVGYSSSWVNSFSTPGVKQATVTVFSGTQTASTSCLTTVVAPPPSSLQVSCSANPTNQKTGNQVAFTANTLGGDGTYSYDWNGDCSSSTSNVSDTENSCTNTFTTEGTKVGTVTVTSAGVSTETSCSSTITNSVDAIQASCSANPLSTAIGQPVVFAASASGGNGTYAYSWSGDCTGSAPFCTKSYATLGMKETTLKVTSAGNSATTNCGTSIEPNNTLQINCTVDKPTASTNQTVTFTCVGTGGTGTYTYSWVNPGDCTGSTTTKCAKSFSTEGIKTAIGVVTSGTESVSSYVSTVIMPGPNASNFSSTQTYCGIGSGQGVGTFAWTYNDPTLTKNETQYDFRVYTNKSSPDTSVVYSNSGNPAGITTGTAQTQTANIALTGTNILNFGTTYYWQVKVYNANGESAWMPLDAGANLFATSSPPSPYPKFTIYPDENNSKNLNFSDTSSCYDSVTNSMVSCQLVSAAAYLWDFGDGSNSTIKPTTDTPVITHTYSDPILPYYTISLTVTQNYKSCSYSKKGSFSTVDGKIIWKEVPPKAQQ